MKKLLLWGKYHPLELFSILAFIITLGIWESPFSLSIPLAWMLLYFIFSIKTWLGSFRLTKTYKYFSTHVFGFRRKGKDLSIQHYIIKRHKKRFNKLVKKHKLDTEEKQESYFKEHPLYLSTASYGYGCKIIDLNQFEILNEITKKPVTYTEFINGSPILAKKVEWAEGLQLILPEAQLGLPNTEHNTLDKKYPWLPVFISLAGHLYDMEIIINSQEFERPWVKIRNQQDYYINAVKTFPQAKGFMDRIRMYLPIIRNGLIQKVRIYQKHESAKQGLLPFDALGLINETSKNVVLTAGQATKENYEATHGDIKEVIIFTRFSDIRYDTRFYHEVVFGDKIPLRNMIKPWKELKKKHRIRRFIKWLFTFKKKKG